MSSSFPCPFAAHIITRAGFSVQRSPSLSPTLRYLLELEFCVYLWFWSSHGIKQWKAINRKKGRLMRFKGSSIQEEFSKTVCMLSRWCRDSTLVDFFVVAVHSWWVSELFRSRSQTLEGLWSGYKRSRKRPCQLSGEYFSILETCLGPSNQCYLTFWNRPWAWRAKQ